MPNFDRFDSSWPIKHLTIIPSQAQKDVTFSYSDLSIRFRLLILTFPPITWITTIHVTTIHKVTAF